MTQGRDLHDPSGDRGTEADGSPFPDPARPAGSAADAELVAAALAGPTGFARLYDQYADRIYDLCAHMLRDEHEAADATAEVFLSAAEHLQQLRDPSRLRPWLYAIARHEVYRRTKRRSREKPVDLNDESFQAPATMIAEHTAELDQVAMAGVIREAALGLDERDRMVLELTLAGGLDGAELGSALGVSTDAAHQATHRMRERLGRSVGALLVARQGKADCAGLRKVLDGWDGHFSVLWRKRVARHVDSCDTCDTRRKGAAAGLLSGSALAMGAPIGFLHLPGVAGQHGAPQVVRQHVLDSAAARVAAGAAVRDTSWSDDGFPPADDAGAAAGSAGLSRRRPLATAAAVLVVLGLAAALFFLLGDRDDIKTSSADTTAQQARKSSATTTTIGRIPGPTSRPPGTMNGGPVVTTTQPPILSPGGPTTTTPTNRTTGGTTGTTGGNTGTTAPTTTGTTTTTTTTTTAPRETTPPTLKPVVPRFLYTSFDRGCQPNPPVRADALDDSGIASVVLRYSGPASGELPMASTGGTGYAVQWNPTVDGSYAVQIVATDNAGNQATTNHTVTAGPCVG